MSKNLKDKRILEGHKKVGKKFIPPMIHLLGGISELSWVNELLPELIWFSILNKRLGLKRGIDLGSKLAKEALEIYKKNNPSNFSFISSYSFLSNTQKIELLEKLEKKDLLETLRFGLKPFLNLYHSSPLNFISNEKTKEYDDKDINEFKDILSKCFDRRCQQAMIIQANVEYVAMITGKLFFFAPIKPPDFNLIIKNFESEESKKACSSIRASINGLYGLLKKTLTLKWPEYFWNRCTELQPIKLDMPVLTKKKISQYKGLNKTIIQYCHLLDKGLTERFNKIPKNIFKSENFEVMSALLARQVSIGHRIARNPDLWDYHVGTIILRSLIDNHITIAWIFKDYEDRIQKYILHGLGQEKLFLEHLENVTNEKENDSLQELIYANKEWLNDQRFSFLAEVNVGSWSGMSTREMAIQADCKDLYDFAYIPFSSSTHSMWNHVGKFNIRYSNNPLHKYCLLPEDLEIEPRLDVLLNSAKYVQKSFFTFDNYFKIKCKTKTPYDFWIEEFENMKKLENPDS